MAEQNIKKFRIPVSDLPPINSITEGYSIRYRVISEDRNRTSYWSPIYLIEPAFTFVPGQIYHTSGSQIVSYSWDAVNILKSIKSVQNINNKSLTSNLATLTTDSAHYMVVGDWVTVSGVDATFNGTYQINAVTYNTFSYYRDSGNVSPTAVSPKGIYTTNSVVGKASDYDIWLRWDRNDGGDWIYKERIQTTSISYPHASFYTINGVVQPSAPNRVSVEIYLKGFPIERGDGVPFDTGSPFLKIYELLNETI